jgi:hypothetical protein
MYISWINKRLDNIRMHGATVEKKKLREGVTSVRVFRLFMAVQQQLGLLVLWDVMRLRLVVQLILLLGR